MAGSDAKDRIIYPLEKRVVNPIVLLAWDLGLPPPGDALLETAGRRTGQPRRTPVCDGLDGDTFWLVAQRGRRADWVQNIAANSARPGQVPQRFRRRLAGRERQGDSLVDAERGVEVLHPDRALVLRAGLRCRPTWQGCRERTSTG
jgi:deazaflavin-dependent oxidoreductase (nitroreductase family)